MKLHGSLALKLYLGLVALAPAVAAATLTADPSAVTFSYTSPEPAPQAQKVTIIANDGTTPALTVTIAPSAGTPASLFTVSKPTGETFQVGIELNTLNSLLNSPGQYSAFITVSAAGFTPLIVPATISVNGQLSISASPSMLTFTAPAGPISQTVSLAGVNGAAISFSLGVSTSTGGGWLSATANGTFTPATLTVTVNSQTLAFGTYSGSVTVTPGTGGPLVIPVTLQVGTNTLTANPTSMAFTYTVGGTVPPAQVLQLSTTLSNNAFIAQASSTGNWLLVNGVTSNVTGALPGSVNVTAVPTGMPPGTYVGVVTVTDSHANVQTVSVTLAITALSGIANPTALSFVAQQGGPVPDAQTVLVAGFANASYTTSVSQNWLSVNPASGPAPAQITVTADPTGLMPGTYSAVLTVNVTAHIQNIQVTFTVSPTPVLTTNAPDLIFAYFGGNPTPAPVNITVSVTGGAAQQFTYAPGVPSWLQVSAGSQPLTTPGVITLTLAPQTLATGTYLAQVILVPSSGPPITLPVIVSVLGATPVVPAITSLTFNASAGAAPQSQTVKITASSSTAYTTSATTAGGGGWLSVAPESGTANLSATYLTITADATTLAQGTYTGTVTITTSIGVATQIAVTFDVTGPGTPITINPTTLSFAAVVNGAAPPSQSVEVTGTQTFTASASTAGGGSWLSVTPTSGSNNATLTVSVNPAGLAASTYTGTITVTPTGGAAQTVSVTLTVSPPGTLTPDPTSLTFTYTAGNPPPVPQSVIVTSSGTMVSFTASATSSGWLSVTPTSGSTPDTLSVSVNPLILGAGTYSGSITLSPAGGAAQVIIPVTLTVITPLPVVDRVVNSASYINGAIAPGEIITLFGSSIGPATGLGATIDSHGFIDTSLGNVQVTFNGFLAPILYASSSQINAIVPYELISGTNALVVVSFGSARSNSLTVAVAPSAPGIYTANASGSGPGAILDLHYHLNSTSNPAGAGDIVQVFATGHGQTTPGGVDGLIEPAVLPLPELLLSYNATVGNQPATIQYIGAAPGLVAGALQVNIVIPAGLPSGPAQLLLTIGGATSQNSVTVALK